MKLIRIAAGVALALALLVVMLGAYTRLTHAGLGCPDWPGCYGKMVLPSAGSELLNAQQAYPDIPIESKKAWTEMVHRYAAGTLALLVIFMAWRALRSRLQGTRLPWFIPLGLVFLIAFQAVLGMWTVTLKLLPIVVMGHLLGGILIFAGLSYFNWQLSAVKKQSLLAWQPWINLGVLIVFVQIALGGWVSSNYAGIACIGFPQCNGEWMPSLHVLKAFNVFSSIGLNYQGGLLDNDSRVTIQFVHRLGALVTAVYLLGLSVFLSYSVRTPLVRGVSAIVLLLLVLQLTLGVINVLYLLPLWAAVLHNGVAALLLAAMLSLRYLVSAGASHGR